MKKRLGLIGLGARGGGMVPVIYLPLLKEKPELDIELAAVCDLYEDRTMEAAKQIEEATGKRPMTTLDYRDIVKNPEIDAVLVTTSWEDHVPITLAALEAGKPAAMEVGGAYSLEDCFALIRTSERTGVPFMLLENCCYGQRELMLLNMVEKGLFGDVVHCEGSYCHDLRQEILEGEKNRHYRLRNYLHRNCENYPTHELGPIMRILKINHGNRIVSLQSVSSCSKGLQQYAREKDPNGPYASQTFQQGDVITTTLRCAGGETIVLTLGTTLPRFYSRGLTIHGTKAFYREDNDSIFLDGEHNEFEWNWKEHWGNASQWEEEYDHPIWAEFRKDPKGSHGGMDWLLFTDVFACLRDEKPLPIDIYDSVTMMAVSVLSEMSIATGGQPVAFPDFTHGKWMMHS